MWLQQLNALTNVWREPGDRGRLCALVFSAHRLQTEGRSIHEGQLLRLILCLAVGSQTGRRTTTATAVPAFCVNRVAQRAKRTEQHWPAWAHGLGYRLCHGVKLHLWCIPGAAACRRPAFKHTSVSFYLEYRSQGSSLFILMKKKEIKSSRSLWLSLFTHMYFACFSKQQVSIAVSCMKDYCHWENNYPVPPLSPKAKGFRIALRCKERSRECTGFTGSTSVQRLSAAPYRR